MNLEKIGTLFKKDTKTKIWWVKLGIALILSNVLFFLLFSRESSDIELTTVESIPAGWVEMQLEADLLTPFQNGKKVLLVHRMARKKMEGVLQGSEQIETGRITILVKEEEAQNLFHLHNWEILPYVNQLSFAATEKEIAHEIRY